MRTLDKQRDARMYEEHYPPRPGIETKIMEALLKSGTPKKLQEIAQELQKLEFSNPDIKAAIWSLIDRGYIEPTSDWKLEGRTEPLSPAPVDWH